MTEHEIVLKAMKQANPVPEEPNEMPPDLSDIVGVITLRPLGKKKAWKPVYVAVGAFAVVLVIGLIGVLADNDGTPSVFDDTAVPTTPAATLAPPGETVAIEDWCDARQFEFDIDIDNVDSVRSGYTSLLAADLFRKLFAPPELTAEADLVAAHTQSVVDALEAADWDVASVDVEPPADVAIARAAIDGHTATVCP